jgi:hypothetical protein
MSEPTEPQPEKKSRVRLCSPARQLASTLLRMEKLVQSETLKENKRADILIRQSEIQLFLLREQQDEKYDAIVAENERLKTEIAQAKANPPDLASEREQSANFLREWHAREVEGLKQQIRDLESRSEAQPDLAENERLASQVAELTAQNVKLEHAKLDAELKMYGNGHD